MSDRHSINSMEQGELEDSPDFSNSPRIRLEMASDLDLKRFSTQDKAAKKRKREADQHQVDDFDDVLRIQPPPLRTSSSEKYKKYKKTSRKSDDGSVRKKSSYERDLEKLERERMRLEDERSRHLVKLQREKDLERDISRKERYGRLDERKKDVNSSSRDYRKTSRGTHSQELSSSHKRSHHERRHLQAAPSPPSPAIHRREERRREHKNRDVISENVTDDKSRIAVTEDGEEEKRKHRPNLWEGPSSIERRGITVEDDDDDGDDDDDDNEDDEEDEKFVEKKGEKEELKKSNSPDSLKSESSPKLGHYQFTRSKFDDDDDDEEEEEEEEEMYSEQFVLKQNVAESHPDLSEDEEPNVPDDRAVGEDNTAIISEHEATPEEVEPALPLYYPGLQGCRNVEEFHCLNRIDEGTYGVVYRAIDLKTQEVVALKRLKMEKEKDGFPITSLREIRTLMKAQHINIVTIRETVVGSNMDKIYIVMDYIEHDLKCLMESMKVPFTIGEVKTLMIQLLRGVQHLHDNWIVHRDLKTSNLLLSHSGILKIGDFGLAREYGSPLKPYTPIVVTLWYRAPELLLGAKVYSTAIDMWSVGCIYAELLMKKPLFPGKSEIDQLCRIFKELGNPNEKIWPGLNELPVMKKATFPDHPYNQLRKRFDLLISEKGFDLMNSLLTYCPKRRASAESALKHDYFDETPLPIDPSMFPTWPAKSELCRTKKSPKPPSGGKAYAKLLADADEPEDLHLKKGQVPSQGFFFKFMA